jgi:hypothetical protein
VNVLFRFVFYEQCIFKKIRFNLRFRMLVFEIAFQPPFQNFIFYAFINHKNDRICDQDSSQVESNPRIETLPTFIPPQNSANGSQVHLLFFVFYCMEHNFFSAILQSCTNHHNRICQNDRNTFLNLRKKISFRKNLWQP